MRTTLALWCLFNLSTAALAGESVSGLKPGEEVTAWEPIHVAGPHAGTKTCPVCTYLDAPILLAFAKDVDAAEKLAKPLEAIAAAHRLSKLRVMLVVIDGSDEQLRKLAKDSSIHAMMLVRPDPERKDKQLKLYKIDPAVGNTVMLYQEYTVKHNWTNAGSTDLAEVKTTADKYLPKR